MCATRHDLAQANVNFLEQSVHGNRLQFANSVPQTLGGRLPPREPVFNMIHFIKGTPRFLATPISLPTKMPSPLLHQLHCTTIGWITDEWGAQLQILSNTFRVFFLFNSKTLLSCQKNMETGTGRGVKSGQAIAVPPC